MADWLATAIYGQSELLPMGLHISHGPLDCSAPRCPETGATIYVEFKKEVSERETTFIAQGSENRQNEGIDMDNCILCAIHADIPLQKLGLMIWLARPQLHDQRSLTISLMPSEAATTFT